MTNLQIQLIWEDPTTGERREPKLDVPIAFGRELSYLPNWMESAFPECC